MMEVLITADFNRRDEFDRYTFSPEEIEQLTSNKVRLGAEIILQDADISVKAVIDKVKHQGYVARIMWETIDFRHPKARGI